MINMSFKTLVGKNPTAAAGAVSLLVLAVWLYICTVVIVKNQWASIEADLRHRANQIGKAAHAVNRVTLRLMKESTPNCTSGELRHLREIVFSTEFIGDIGILNQDGRVACTAVADLIGSPVALPKPSITFVNAVGIPVSVYYKLQLLPSEEDTRSTMTVAGRFLIMLNPFTWERLSSSNDGSLARLVLPDGTSYVAAGKEESIGSEAIRKLLAAAPSQSEKFSEFVWSPMTFVASLRVEGVRYFVQNAVPVGRFWLEYRQYFFAALLVGCLIAYLVFNLARETFIHWQSIEYRIDDLLREENILCVYQPILDLRSKKPVGCEVLVRLKDGDALIPPDVAIPPIIAKGLTSKLDRLVYTVANRELLKALPQLVNFKVAFNFFPETISSGDVYSLVFQDIETNKTRHRGLLVNVEILEQQYQDSVIKEVKKLREDGILISVDDFGTGYSNLGSVKAISPDFLKVDRSFVRDMEDNTVRSSLIPEVAAIARAVSARLIAEGIENSRQMDRLVDMGVEYGQGYFICKPAPIEGLVTFLRECNQTV